MPEKTDEERERIAKKLAEQRAKMEGMPTTAKVSTHSGTTVLSLAVTIIIIVIDAFGLFISSKLMSLSPMSMK